MYNHRAVRLHFRRAYGARILCSPPATEVAGYYQRSLRDVEIDSEKKAMRSGETPPLFRSDG
jgi:hypothetical protein